MTRTQRMIALGGGVLALAAPALYFYIQPADPVSAVRRLCGGGKLIGVSEADLCARYGPSGDPTYFKGWDDLFIIGREDSYFAIDNSWLVVRYDAQRRVQEARVLVD